MKRLTEFILVLGLLVGLSSCVPSTDAEQIVTFFTGGLSCAGIWEWTGDHASGEGYSCEGVNASATDGTDRVDAAYGETGNGFIKTNPNEYMEWLNSGTSNFNRAIGTLWMRVNAAATTDEDNLFGLYINVNNAVSVYLQDTGRIVGWWTGTATGNTQASAAGDIITDGNWAWVGYSWYYNADLDNNHCGQVDDGSSSWACADNNELRPLASDPSDFGLGENDWNQSGTTDADQVYIDRIIIYDTYQAAHP